MPVAVSIPENDSSTNSSAIGHLIYHAVVEVEALFKPDPRVTVMLVILVVSMIAVSFPAVSNSGVVRVPTALFFIGKHFGTGVILATAFVHLLPDSFYALLNESVSKEYGNVGRWVGLIILGSLLTIFLVEYISTTFVDHLHAEPSAPPSLQQSPNLPVSALPLDASPSLLPFLANAPKIIRLRNNVACVCQNGVCICIPEALVPSEHAEHSTATHERHHHEHHAHSEHHHEEKRRIGRRRQIVGIFVLQVGIMIHSVVIGLTLSITSGADFTSLTTAIIFHQIFEGLSLGIRIAALPHKDKKQKESDIEERYGSPSAPSISELEGLDGITVRPDLQSYGGGGNADETQPRLQLHLQSEDRGEGSSASTSPQSTVVNQPESQAGGANRKLTLVDGSTLRTSRPPTLRRSHSTTSLKHNILDWSGWGSLFSRQSQNRLPISHQHHGQNGYGGTLHADRHPSSSNEGSHIRSRAGEGSGRWMQTSRWRPNPLKSTLSVLFAITTPLGMALGLIIWKGAREGGSEQASMKLTQGVMSAISAGMLIYAATVEMIAGDFVFGDLEGHHHHGSGGVDHHHHQQQQQEDDNVTHSHSHHQGPVSTGEGHHAGHHPSIGKRVVAVLSLLMGVVAMVVIGLGEPDEH